MKPKIPRWMYYDLLESDWGKIEIADIRCSNCGCYIGSDEDIKYDSNSRPLCNKCYKELI